MFNRIVSRLEQRAHLHGEMMRRFGFGSESSVSMTQGMLLRQTVHRCIGCAAAERCTAWLSETAGYEGAEAFCPNAEAFLELGWGKEPADPK